MNCADFEAQLDAYIDNELPPAVVGEMTEHLDACAACARSHERQLALRRALTQHAPALQAPPGLRASIRQAIRAQIRPAATPRLPEWRWLAAAAVLVGVVAGTWRVATTQARAEALTDALLASHVRSLLGSHLLDVASSDQHTVKPWFNGKLDYSPSVYDLAGRGYPLLGGRLASVANHAGAGLVNGRGQHGTSGFLWPAGRGPPAGPATVPRQGYPMLPWIAPDSPRWGGPDLRP